MCCGPAGGAVGHSPLGLEQFGLVRHPLGIYAARLKSTAAVSQETAAFRSTLIGRLSGASSIWAVAGGEALSAGVQPALRRQLQWWLGGTAAWVYTMVVLGGVTRLTRSGLSMTDWKFTGVCFVSAHVRPHISMRKQPCSDLHKDSARQAHGANALTCRCYLPTLVMCFACALCHVQVSVGLRTSLSGRLSLLATSSLQSSNLFILT